MRLRRRDIFKAAAASAAAFALPGLEGCKVVDLEDHEPPATGAFRHGVASGDPLPKSVILWSRVSRDDAASGPDAPGPVEVSWEIARDARFVAVVGGGKVMTDAERDFTVKIDAAGLDPATTYYYRFRALGETSPIGRTRTAPLTASRLRFAVVSCSSLAHGYFHVYADIAERADLDAVIHLGDYLYEYEDGGYGGERPSLPENEIVSLSDYRTRFAQYRSDQDLREVHRQHPFITTWDDHEVADNAFLDGAGNHNEDEGEGRYEDRRRAAFRAYGEWMPIRGDLGDRKIWRALRYGNVADLLILDTRHWAKAQQSSDEDPARGAPERQILGLDQEAWLFEQLRTSTAQWKIVCQQVLMSPLPQYLNTDGWDGYPAARQRFYDAIEKGGVKDVVVLTGDIHASFGNDLARAPTEPGAYDPLTGRGSLAVEIVAPAVTSPTPNDPDDAGDLVAANTWMKYVDLERNGYVLLDLDAQRATATYLYVDDVESRDGQKAIPRKTVATLTGESTLRDAEPATDRPEVAPLAPLSAAARQSAATRTRRLPAAKPAMDRQPFGARRTPR